MRHKHRHTNHHAAASLAFKFAPAPLGVTHDASATRPATSTTAPPCPSPTRRARGTGRAIAREAVFESRVVVVVSSSVVRSGHTGISRNAATNRKRSGPYRTATRGVPERSESGDLRTCLVAFSRCDAAAGRPGGCEHFPCLGHSCMTPGRATNHPSSLSSRSPMPPAPGRWLGQIGRWWRRGSLPQIFAWIMARACLERSDFAVRRLPLIFALK